MPTELASTWFGAFEMDAGRPVRSFLAPPQLEALVDRMRARRRGERVVEEDALLAGLGTGPHISRDRRLWGPSVTRAVASAVFPAPSSVGVDPRWKRAAMLEVAALALAEGWDPSIHVDEAVRALTDLDSMQNLLGERIVSWSSRDLPPSEEGSEDAAAAVRSLVQGAVSDPDRAPEEPELVAARRALARLYRAVGETRHELEEAIDAGSARRAPNLTALLGASLAGKMISQAGGLERLARLPASTVQMLGAERAFFDHLRGRAPPPRHGLLFLHRTIQGAPRRQRGRLARALAGKVAIAARMDLAGSGVEPALAESYERRRAEVQANASRPGKPRDRSARRVDRPSRGSRR